MGLVLVLAFVDLGQSFLNVLVRRFLVLLEQSPLRLHGLADIVTQAITRLGGVDPPHVHEEALRGLTIGDRYHLLGAVAHGIAHTESLNGLVLDCRIVLTLAAIYQLHRLSFFHFLIGVNRFILLRRIGCPFLTVDQFDLILVACGWNDVGC